MELANTAAGSISFNTNSATRGSISSAGVWRLHNLAGTGDRVVVASSNGTLSASTSVTGLVDTTTISTRAWRQKGIDSVAALSRIGGSGSANYVAKFTAASTIGNSQIFDDGTSVGVGTTSPNIYSSSSGAHKYLTVSNNAGGGYSLFTVAGGAGGGGEIDFGNQTIRHAAIASLDGSNFGIYTNNTNSGTGVTERLRVFANGRIGINTTTDAGYQLDINGTLRSVNGANFATTSGNVGIGTTTAQVKLHIKGTALTNSVVRLEPLTSTTIYSQIVGNNGDLILQADPNNAEGSSNISMQIDGNEFVRLNSNGDFGIGTVSPMVKLHIKGTALTKTAIRLEPTTSTAIYSQITGDNGDIQIQSDPLNNEGSSSIKFEIDGSEKMRMTAAGEFYINTTTDAGDYKLQVSGNALVTAGKLDITTNTAFGIGIARSGTSEVAGQIYNSNGILYTGVESSAGGQIFSGSSAYAAVIGSGANYPLQFATNNATRATINTNGELLINTTTDNGDFKLQVNGSALISGSIQTANPVSGTAVPWRLGSVVATNVQLDTANYVEVNINGTFYRLAIVTPL